MNPNPTQTVLSSMRRHGVRCLLMGGQACVFYGAAEFSRDVDFVILAEPENLRRLQAALHELKAEVIAIPAFEASYLHRGLVILFPVEAAALRSARPALAHAISNDADALEEALEQERRAEVVADRAYWAPLRQELERLRHSR